MSTLLFEKQEGTLEQNCQDNSSKNDPRLKQFISFKPCGRGLHLVCFNTAVGLETV